MQLITLIRTLNTDSLAFYSMLFTFRQTLDLFRSIFQTLHTLKSHHWNLGPGDQDWNQITLMKSNKVILKWRPRTTRTTDDWVVPRLTTDWVNASNWVESLGYWVWILENEKQHLSRQLTRACSEGMLNFSKKFSRMNLNFWSKSWFLILMAAIPFYTITRLPKSRGVCVVSKLPSGSISRFGGNRY